MLVPGLGLADDHTRIAAIYKCTLNDGVTLDQVMEINKRWLVNVRKLAGTDEINSYALEPMVGNLEHFYSIDSYPDPATWSAAKSAESDEGQAIEDAFNELMECTKNRLYKGTQH